MAQTRERTLRIAVVPLSRRPTLHRRVQQSELEQDCRKKEEGIGKMSNMLLLKIAVILKSLLIGTKITANGKETEQMGRTNNSLVNAAGQINVTKRPML